MPDFNSQLSSCFSLSQTLEKTSVISHSTYKIIPKQKKPRTALSQFVSSPEPGVDECVSGQSRRSCSSSQSFTFLCVPRLQSLFVRPAFSFYLLAFIFLFNWWRDRLQTWAGWTLSVMAAVCSNVLRLQCCTSIFVHASLSALVLFAHPRRERTAGVRHLHRLQFVLF